MQTVKKLLKANNDKKLGNHRVEHTKNKLGNDLRVFYYYYTPICTVNDTRKTFTIDSSYGTVSTTRACNSYRNELKYTHDEIEL